MKTSLLSSTIVAAICSQAHAVTITLDCEVLKDAFGLPMPISGIVVLTAATDGLFFGPTPTSFVSGSEILLKKWDLTAAGPGTEFGPGVFSDTTGDLRFADGWNTGDQLRMYWYPTLTASATEPGAETSYGSYSDPLGLLDGGTAWVTPAESDTIGLVFFTSDASFLTAGGSNNATAGVANRTVTPVPEPATAALSLAGLVSAAGMSRFRKRRTV